MDTYGPPPDPPTEPTNYPVLSVREMSKPVPKPRDLDWNDTDVVHCYKKWLFKQMLVEVRPTQFVPYDPHKGQMPIHFPVHGEEWDVFVCSAGQRGGKSIAAAAEIVARLGMPGQRIWIVAPTYDLANRVFEMVHDFVVRQKIHGGSSVRKSSNTKDNRSITMRWKSPSWVRTKSCENPNSLTGDKLTFIVLDEAAQVGEEIWVKFLEPRLVNLEGQALLISSPLGFNWFWKYHQRGTDAQSRAEGWRSGTFKTVDNPWVSKDWLAKKRRLTPREDWEENYEGAFVSHAGLVYKGYRDEFYPKGQLFDPDIDKIDPTWTFFRAIDIGIFHPTACVWGAVDPPGNVWLYQDYLREGPSHQEHARAIEDLTQYPVATSWISPDAKRRSGTGDGSDAPTSAEDVYNDAGVYVRVANDRVADGISMVQSMLKAALAAPKSSTDPRLYISRDCVHVREGLKTYLRQGRSGHQREQVKSDLPAKPRKYKDDAVDALRYLIAGRPTHERPDEDAYDEDSYIHQGERVGGGGARYQRPMVDWG